MLSVGNCLKPSKASWDWSTQVLDPGDPASPGDTEQLLPTGYHLPVIWVKETVCSLRPFF